MKRNCMTAGALSMFSPAGRRAPWRSDRSDTCHDRSVLLLGQLGDSGARLPDALQTRSS